MANGVYRKVSHGQLGTPISIVLVWFFEVSGIKLPTEVAMSMAGILIFLIGWMIKERE
jgi:hypothetical protein